MDGKLEIDGFPLQVMALDLFDGLDNQVLVFIEVNRCKFPPVESVKRVLSPDSKLFFVGAANQFVIGTALEKERSIASFAKYQPGMYSLFDKDDIQLIVSGFGPDRIGLPQLKRATELPELRVDERLKMPRKAYGFMYFLCLKSYHSDRVLLSIRQYIALTGYEHYVLVGAFTSTQKAKLSDALTLLRASPTITYYDVLPSLTMQHMIARSQRLVATTGVMSTIEAMLHGQLPFYQRTDCNELFVASYLMAVKSMCTSNAIIFGFWAGMIVQLSELLFAPKPLSSDAQQELEALLDIKPVYSYLIETNQKIIDKANGRIAGQLLSFIGKASKTTAHNQCVAACLAMREGDEVAPPTYREALNRAAFGGYLLELRVLLRSLSPDECSSGDPHYQQRSPLHHAVIEGHLDCARALIRHGVRVDAQDVGGKTPFHHAMLGKNQALIQLLGNEDVSLKGFF